MRRVRSVLAAIAAQLEQRLFDGGVQLDERVGPGLDARPQDPWATQVWEAADAGDRKVESRQRGRRLDRGPADAGQFPVVDFAQKQQSQMKIGRLDPLYIRAVSRQFVLESLQSVDDCFAGIDRQKC